ncbi:MAG: HNH endonuclease [Actinomycetota bacterium]|nr:HNH endonuclease [Actinomycetota bacterium]
MLSPTALADRDGPLCWLCGNEVSPSAPRGSRDAGSVDHVVPRARGGGDEDDNLRLAHRACNSRRGSRLPELDWPREVPVVDHAEIWPVLRRALRRPGEWEVVGVVVGEEGARVAQQWLGPAVHDVLGGAWEVRARPVGPGLTALALRTVREQAPRRTRTPARVRRRALR